MNISELALKRPILATVMNLLIILFGVVGYNFLSVREYPAIDPPVVNVRTSYAGANADIIESQITEPLEKSINGIPGIKTINSSSNNGSSNISIEFEVDQDLEAAANDVRDKVSQATRNLPQDIDAPPVVSKSDASSDFLNPIRTESSINVGYGRAKRRAKASAFTGLSRVRIPMNATSVYFSDNAARVGASARQGAHHDAHTFTTATWPTLNV